MLQAAYNVCESIQRKKKYLERGGEKIIWILHPVQESQQVDSQISLIQFLMGAGKSQEYYI